MKKHLQHALVVVASLIFGSCSSVCGEGTVFVDNVCVVDRSQRDYLERLLLPQVETFDILSFTILDEITAEDGLFINQPMHVTYQAMVVGEDFEVSMGVLLATEDREHTCLAGTWPHEHKAPEPVTVSEFLDELTSDTARDELLELEEQEIEAVVAAAEFEISSECETVLNKGDVEAFIVFDMLEDVNYLPRPFYDVAIDPAIEDRKTIMAQVAEYYVHPFAEGCIPDPRIERDNCQFFMTINPNAGKDASLIGTEADTLIAYEYVIEAPSTISADAETKAQFSVSHATEDDFMVNTGYVVHGIDDKGGKTEPGELVLSYTIRPVDLQKSATPEQVQAGFLDRKTLDILTEDGLVQEIELPASTHAELANATANLKLSDEIVGLLRSEWKRFNVFELESCVSTTFDEFNPDGERAASENNCSSRIVIIQLVLKQKSADGTDIYVDPDAIAEQQSLAAAPGFEPQSVQAEFVELPIINTAKLSLAWRKTWGNCNEICAHAHAETKIGKGSEFDISNPKTGTIYGGQIDIGLGTEGYYNSTIFTGAMGVWDRSGVGIGFGFDFEIAGTNLRGTNPVNIDSISVTLGQNIATINGLVINTGIPTEVGAKQAKTPRACASFFVKVTFVQLCVKGFLSIGVGASFTYNSYKQAAPDPKYKSCKGIGSSLGGPSVSSLSGAETCIKVFQVGRTWDGAAAACRADRGALWTPSPNSDLSEVTRIFPSQNNAAYAWIGYRYTPALPIPSESRKAYDELRPVYDEYISFLGKGYSNDVAVPVINAYQAELGRYLWGNNPEEYLSWADTAEEQWKYDKFINAYWYSVGYRTQQEGKLAEMFSGSEPMLNQSAAVVYGDDTIGARDPNGLAWYVCEYARDTRIAQITLTPYARAAMEATAALGYQIFWLGLGAVVDIIRVSVPFSVWGKIHTAQQEELEVFNAGADVHLELSTLNGRLFGYAEVARERVWSHVFFTWKGIRLARKRLWGSATNFERL